MRFMPDVRAINGLTLQSADLTLKTVSHYINGELDLIRFFLHHCLTLVHFFWLGHGIIYPARLEKLMILESATEHYLPGDHSTYGGGHGVFQPYHRLNHSGSTNFPY